eukprot:3554983-Pleurochrysis_carterae.AAC.4
MTCSIDGPHSTTQQLTAASASLPAIAESHDARCSVSLGSKTSHGLRKIRTAGGGFPLVFINY